MSQLDKAIRPKRFKVKSSEAVYLTVELPTGETCKLKVIDCSINGIRCEYEKVYSEDLLNFSNCIVSSSKLTWMNQENFLGRLAFRRVSPKDNLTHMVFSTIDTKVPIDGSLSKCLDLNFDNFEGGAKEELSSEKFNLASFIETDYQNADLFDRMRKFDTYRKEWEKSDKYGYKTVRECSKGERVNLSRKRKGNRNDYIVMGSNDYLGLGAHPDVVHSAQVAMNLYGFGSTGSPVTTGTTDLHIKLCEKLAVIHKQEAALLFNSGYAANVGIISSVTTQNDLIVADQLCHASIQDGMQMSRATSRFFKHNDVAHLESILQKERNNYNGCLVITEGVFSMDGDLAKLDEIFKVARKYNARIMVDQAHCFGVVGPNGLGICDKYNLLKEVDIIMGTFSKICGAIGGFAVGSTEVIEWIRAFGRAHVFSVSLPPSTVAAAHRAIEIFSNQPEITIRLKNNIKYFCKGLSELGFKIENEHESAVVPVVIGDEKKLGQIYQSLLDDGVSCVPIVYPAVSRKNCRFRFTLMSTHTQSDLDYVISSLEKAMLKSAFDIKNIMEPSKVAS